MCPLNTPHMQRIVRRDWWPIDSCFTAFGADRLRNCNLRLCIAVIAVIFCSGVIAPLWDVRTAIFLQRDASRAKRI